MHKLKIWFCGKFLPAWCREELLDENKRLTCRVDEMKQENDRLHAYISGTQDALRLGRRIKIYTGEVRGDGSVECTDGQQDL